MTDDQQNISQSPIIQKVGEKEKEERLKRILVLYEEIGRELARLKVEGSAICHDLQKLVDDAKLKIIKQRINKDKN